MRTAFALVLWALLAFSAFGQTPVPDVEDLVDASVLREIAAWTRTEIVRNAVRERNTRYGALSQAEIDALDAEWRTERSALDKPLIAGILSSPLSDYLLRMQAQSRGAFVEILVTDRRGLNVGQSSITYDFWQGDEPKFKNTFDKGVGAIFIDKPEWDDELKIWRVQVSETLADSDGHTPIGAVTVELNLNELQRRKNQSRP